MLDLFVEYGIHATWAVVGFLFFDHTRAAEGHLFAVRLPLALGQQQFFPAVGAVNVAGR